MTIARIPWWQRDLPPIDAAASSSMDAALSAAGLDFSVEMRQIAHSAPYGNWCREDKWRAVVRNDTDAALGIVGGRYRPIQHRDALAFVTEICESFDASIDRVWSLGGGARIRVCTRYKRDVDIAGIDQVRPWLLFTASHDGREAVTMQVIPIQMACTNQIPMLRRLGGVHRIVHSPKAQSKLRTAAEAILSADRSMDALGVELERLLQAKIGAEASQALVENAVAASHGSPKAKEDDANSVVSLMKDPLTLPEGAEGTRFAVLHAVTEHYCHVRRYRTRAAQERELTQGRASAICRRTMEMLKA